MPLPPIPGARIGSDPQLAQQQAQQAVRDAFAALSKNCPLLSGVLVGPQTLALSYAANGSASAVDTVFKHGLGREAKGWIVVGTTAPTQLYLSSEENKLPNSQLVLSHDSTEITKVTLWVF